MAFTPITVSGTYLNEDRTPAIGTICFQLSAAMQSTTDGQVIPAVPIYAELDSNGAFSQVLYANDDTTTTPTGTTYKITEIILGASTRSYSVQLSQSLVGHAVNIATLPPVTNTQVFTYCLTGNNLSDLASASSARTHLGLDASSAVTFASLAASSISGALADNGGQVYNVKHSAYGAKGNGKALVDGAMTATSATLTSPTASFTSADVGKTVVVAGAGAAGIGLITTIAAYASATQVTLAATASTTVTAAKVHYGSDDSTAINAALTAASAAGGGTVLIPPGIYLGKEITVPSNCRLSGHGVTILKSGGSSGTVVVRLNGTVSATSSALTSDCATASTTVAVASGALFSAGQYCVLYDTRYQYVTSGRNQEIVRVASVSGNTVTLVNPTYGTPTYSNYAVASGATLAVLNAVTTAAVEGVKLVNIDYGGLIYGSYCYDVVVRNVECVGPNNLSGVRIDQSQNVLLDHCRVRDSLSNVSPAGYGLMFNESCINCHAISCFSENIRENPCFSNNCRACSFIGCRDINSFDSSFNSHGTGNFSCLIAFCHSIYGQGTGIAVGYSDDHASDQGISVIGNTIIAPGNNGISVVSNNDGTHPHKRILIQGNNINGFGRLVTGTGIALSTVWSVGVLNNEVSSSSYAGHSAISVSSCRYFAVKNNLIFNNANSHGILWNQSVGGRIKSNDLQTGSTGTALWGTGSNINVWVEDNLVDKPYSNSIFSGTEILANNRFNFSTQGSLDNGNVLALTYAATVTPSPHQAPYLTLAVTDTNAFTIANANTTAGQGSWTLTIKNSSGGSMGVITWGAGYVFTNGAWTNPANGKSRNITFFYDGTNFVEQARSTADF